MAVTFTLKADLADFGVHDRAGIKVRITAEPEIKKDSGRIHSDRPEDVTTDPDGKCSKELLSAPGLWYRVTTPYVRAINPVRFAAYIPDPLDPTTGVPFPPDTVIHLDEIMDEDPTPGYDGVFIGGRVPTGGTVGQRLTKVSGTDFDTGWADLPDADAATKGVVKLAGDLGGTADAPTVPGLADKADATEVTKSLADTNRVDRYGPSPRWVSAFQPSHGWTASGGATITDDTSTYLYGSQSLRVDNGFVTKSGLSMDLTGKVLVLRFRKNSFTAGSSLNIRVGNTSLTNYAEWEDYLTGREEGEWYTIQFPWASGSMVGTPDRGNIQAIRIGIAHGSGSVNLQAVGSRENPARRGVVTFVFDDGSASQWKAAQILGQRGVAGTLYQIPHTDNVTEMTNPAKYLTVDQIKAMRDLYGWDIQAHNYDQIVNYQPEVLRAYMDSALTWFHDNGLGTPRHYCYPGGASDATARSVISEFFLSARSTTSGLETSSPPAEPYRMRSVVYPFWDNNLAPTKQAIDRAVADNLWAIITLHIIVPGAPSSSIECSESALAEIVDYAIAAGADIRTVSGVLGGDAVVPRRTSSAGNLLPENIATGTDALQSAAGFDWSNATISSSTEQAASGSRSLKIVSTVTGTYLARVALTGLIPGQVYTVQAKYKNGVGSRSYSLDVGSPTPTNIVRTSSPLAAPATFSVIETTFIPTQSTHTLFLTSYSGTPGSIGDSFYVDEIGLWKGAGGTWAPPGVEPIRDLGIRVRRPNGTDRAVEQWNGTAWSLVDYYSGWRDVSADLQNGWTGGLIMCRRNDTVELRPKYAGLNGSAKTSTIFYTPAEGFRTPLDNVLFGPSGNQYPVYGHFSTGGTTLVAIVGEQVVSALSASTTVTNLNGGAVRYPTRNDGIVPPSLPGTTLTSAPS